MQSPLLEDFSLKEINPTLEAFSEATHADATSHLANIMSKVYHLPKLWYLRVNVIEARDLIPSDNSQLPNVYVTGILGNQTLKTRLSKNGSNNPAWNEDMMFVAEEPFNEPLILNVQHRGNIDEVIGTCAIPLQSVDTRLDDKAVNTKWVDLEKHVILDGDEKFTGKIHVRICLEGGYHVLYESTDFNSDLRPTAKELWKPSIGVLKLVILNARNLSPVKTNDRPPERMDAYCVAKYGQKWVRTRTVLDNFAPTWNEQYTWEVFDPCTVVTIGVFNNCHLRGGEKYKRDSIMGKVRIRLSSLEMNRLYAHSYPLLVLHPSGNAQVYFLNFLNKIK